MKLISKYIFIFFILWGNNHLHTQNAENPFELKYRVEETIENQENNITSEEDFLIKTSNPFDIIESHSSIVTTPKLSPIITKKEPTKESQDSEKKLSFLVLFYATWFFTSVATLSRDRIIQSYQAVFNDNFSRQLQRVNEGNFSLGYLLLYFLFLLNAGLFIFLAGQKYGFQIPDTIGGLLYTCLVVIAFFVFKHLLLFFVQAVFPISKEIRLYSFTIMIFSILLGLILFPINALLAFSPDSISKLAVWLGLGAILVIYSLKSLRGLSIASKYWMLYIFHFLLYLCAVEILPAIILIKFLMMRIH